MSSVAENAQRRIGASRFMLVLIKELPKRILRPTVNCYPSAIRFVRCESVTVSTGLCRFVGFHGIDEAFGA